MALCFKEIGYSCPIHTLNILAVKEIILTRGMQNRAFNGIILLTFCIQLTSTNHFFPRKIYHHGRDILLLAFST